MIRPLQQLLETFQGPTRLITKRQDKHIDFSASAQRAEKNRDPNKDKMVCIYFLRKFNDVKFIYFEKATKFCEISTLLLPLCTLDKSKVEIS